MKGTKQSLNLTNYTWYILRCDYSAFTNRYAPSKNIGAGFLCDIFMKYYRDAKSSIGIRISEREAEIRNMLGTRGNKELRDLFLKFDTERITREATEVFTKTAKKDSETHTIYVPDNVRSAILHEAMGSEKYYYSSYKTPGGHYMKYFRAVLEEYTGLPYCRREAIYFSDNIHMLRTAINECCAVRFRYGEEEVCGYPFAIESDEWSSYNYLLAADTENNLRHFRISRIKYLNNIYNDKSNIPDDVRASISEQQIIPVGIQFVGEPIAAITVKLSEEGMKMYDQMIFLRPQYSSVDKLTSGEYICTFRCSVKQIRYYFFKFGAEAEIVSPADIREHFSDEYLAAYQKYEKK